MGRAASSLHWPQSARRGNSQLGLPRHRSLFSLIRAPAITAAASRAGEEKKPLGEGKGSEDTRFAASRESLNMPGYIHAAARYLGTSEKVRGET